MTTLEIKGIRDALVQEIDGNFERLMASPDSFYATQREIERFIRWKLKANYATTAERS